MKISLSDIMMTGFQRLTMEQYRKAEGIARSDLWKFATSLTPVEYQWTLKQPKPLPYDEKEAFRHGTALHLFLLEREGYEDRVLEDLENKTRGQGIREVVEKFRQNINQSESILVAPDFKSRLDELDALLHDGKHEGTRTILEDPEALIETSWFWIDNETGATLKIRPDLIECREGSVGNVWDLKYTTETRKPLSTLVYDHGYHWQAGMILDGLTAITGIPHDTFGNIVCYFPPAGPVDVARYLYPQEVIEDGRMEYRQALYRYLECQADDNWPGMPDETQWVERPRWRRGV